MPKDPKDGADYTEPSRAGILLAVPDDAERAAVADRLRAVGYDLYEASTGQDAIRLSYARDMDLLIFHSDYPDRRGVEVVRSIREHSDAPALGIYGIACREVILDFFEAGATDCTYAPMNVEECVYRAHSLLGHRPRTGPAATRATLFGP